MGTQIGEISDLEALWTEWENSALSKGFAHSDTQRLAQQIEALEGLEQPSNRQAQLVYGDTSMAKAHKLFDRLLAKRATRRSRNGLISSLRFFETPYGAVYENGVSVRGIERLMEQHAAALPALKLVDGFYHINNLPGVQPGSSKSTNTRNRNVECVKLDVVERFIKTCKATGMEKRGWKKSVNEQFELSRQEFSKWLLRYFPCFGLPVPIDRKDRAANQ